MPDLWFDMQAEEAVAFCTSVFPDSRTVRVAHSAEAGPGPAGSVMTVEFVLDGQRFVAVDGGPEFPVTEAVSLQVDCRDQDQVDHYWARLGGGGGGGGGEGEAMSGMTELDRRPAARHAGRPRALIVRARRAAAPRRRPAG